MANPVWIRLPTDLNPRMPAALTLPLRSFGMPRRHASWFRALGSLLMTFLFAGMAIAQSQVCEQIRSELASLANAGISGGATRDSMRLRTELSQVRLAMQRNECNRQGFFIFGSPPAVCGPLRNQAAQYEAAIRQIEGGTASPAGARRGQLIAALERYGCVGAQPQQRGVIYAAPNNPTLFDQLFGDPNNRQSVVIDPDAEPRERLGGRTAVCVRLCDGFFFPVNFEGIGARDEYEPVCAALCPAAETRVYFMPLGADIERAATRGGEPYMSLPAAKLYQQKHDAACYCKPQGQTWAAATAGAEDLVERRKGDLVVTPEQAQAMSRPKDPNAPATDRRSKRNEPPKAAAIPQATPQAAEAPAALPESALPTGGNASSGIGRRAVQERVVNADGGVRQQVTGADGTRRNVRNIAPELTGKEPPVDLRGEARP